MITNLGDTLSADRDANHNMNELNVQYVNGAWHLGHGDDLRPICQDRVPVAAFSAGWRPRSAVAVSDSLIVLALRDEDGKQAAWFLDRNYEFRTNTAAELPEDARLHLSGIGLQVMAQVAMALITGKSDGTPRSKAEARVASTLGSDAGLKTAILNAIVPKTDSVVLEDATATQRPDALQTLAEIFGRPANPQALKDFFRQDLLRIQTAAALSGVVEMPSPITGATARCDAAWCIELAAVAFRFATPDPADTFIAVCANFQLTLFGVYFPRRSLFLYVNDRGLNETHRVLRSPPEQGLWDHVIQYADDLSERPAELKPTLLCFYDHLGHHLWNELVGIRETLAVAGAERMPPILVIAPDATEMYGRIGEIFPEVRGMVTRLTNGHKMVRHVYATGLLPLRPSGIRVTRDLAARISALAEHKYLLGLPQRMLDGLRGQDYRVVILGLRVENRTVVEFPAFCEQLIAILQQELGKVVVIVDGQNCSESGFRYRVTFQDAAAESLFDIETRIARRLSDRFAGHPDVVILSTIGLPVGASIALGNKADFFVTPWGAGLAKYRWISNLPGLALAGPSCVRHQPVHLYDDPYFIEDPAPMYFMDPKDVEDASDDPRLITPGAIDRVNIRVDMDAMRARIRDMVADLGIAPVDRVR